MSLSRYPNPLRGAPLAGLGLLACACLAAGGVARAGEGAPGQLTVRAENDAADGDTVHFVTVAAQHALPYVAQWGGLRMNTAIVILADRDDLEARVHAEGDDWADAWALYDTIYLVSLHKMQPSGRMPSFDFLVSLLAHELTHCVMFQMAGSGARFPLWFNEGMAIATSQEASWYLSRDEVTTILGRRPNLDPLRDRYLAHGEARLAYSVAYFAFTLLEEAHGATPIVQVLATMRTGATFPDAFARVYGESLDAFEDRLLRALRTGDPVR
ncbi:MAG TPA: hypothetical protein VMB50_10485 [Myxococcales bacterium]|nr:hypothetical protein [Myxococcales bacterium]